MNDWPCVGDFKPKHLGFRISCGLFLIPAYNAIQNFTLPALGLAGKRMKHHSGIFWHSA